MDEQPERARIYVLLHAAEREASMIPGRRARLLAQLAEQEAQIKATVADLQSQLRLLRPAKPLPAHFMDVAQERLGQDVYAVILLEAQKRQRQVPPADPSPPAC